MKFINNFQFLSIHSDSLYGFPVAGWCTTFPVFSVLIVLLVLGMSYLFVHMYILLFVCMLYALFHCTEGHMVDWPPS